MSTETIKATAESEIRKLMDSWLKAVLASDIDRILSHYAPDIVAYDAVVQLQFKGVDAYGKHWKNCLSMCPGPMVFEIHDLNITYGDDVAYGHYLCRCGGTGEGGEEKAGWTRATVGYRKTDGRWRIAHEHFSVPFDMATGKALLDLEP
jgi:uncharacterized protein (TIGR02246 family)